MKWLILFAIVFSLLVLLLQSSPPIDANSIGAPAPGNVAMPFAMVVILFVLGVGVFKLFRDN